ncbi:MAG TPA: RNA 2',3'-cyclic phosphodiesterase [Thermoplasmata archaeon]|nr:RNA 2',3'-cyclic phosphodiesterase [Thermoplasmata archaeon]
MRAFLSVDVPDPRETPPGRSPSHLTLKFLGEISVDAAERLAASVRAAVAPVPAFALELRGVGAFPDPERPRVVWAGIGDGADELAELARRVEDAAAAVGLAREPRPFLAHVTILRVRGPRDAERARAWLSGGPDRVFGRTEIRDVVLNSSELRREGAIHRELDRFPLSERPKL